MYYYNNVIHVIHITFICIQFI